MERKPGRDGARLRRDVRAQAPSEMPRGYATAGARVGDALAAQRDDANIGAIDKPTTRRLLRTSNANTVVAVARCKCIEDVTTFITRIELLDRINLLSATVTAPLACVGRTSHARGRNSTGGRRIAPPPSQTPRTTAEDWQM